MEVKIDADELCQLKRDADKNRTWDYNKVLVDSYISEVDRLREERDKWRKMAVRTARAADKNEAEVLSVLGASKNMETWESALLGVAKIFKLNTGFVKDLE